MCVADPPSRPGSIGNAFVVSLSHIPKDGRVLRQIACLVGAGWTVTAIGCGRAGAVTQTAIVSDGVRHVMVPPPVWSMTARLRAAADLAVGRLAANADAAIGRALRLPAVRALCAALRTELGTQIVGTPVLVVANDWMALPAALAAQSAHRVPFHYDSHELAIAEHAGSRSWRLLFPPTIAALEHHAIDRARSVSTVSPGIAADMQGRYAMRSPPTVIRNVPDGTPLAPRPVTTPINVLYHGLFKPDRGVLELIASVPAWPDHFRLTVRGWSPQPAFEAAVRAAIATSPATHRITVEPPVSPDRVVIAANAADIGVFLPDLTSPQNRYCMPNKLFEYLHGGLMVIVPAGCDMADLVAAQSCGLVLADPSATGLARALAALTPDGIAGRKAAAHQAAQTLTWADESRQLARLFSPPVS